MTQQSIAQKYCEGMNENSPPSGRALKYWN